MHSNNRTLSTSGVLTFEMIQEQADRISNMRFVPDSIIIPYGAVEQLIAWQKQEQWLKSLPAINEKMERLRIRLKNRKPHTVMNLPE